MRKCPACGYLLLGDGDSCNHCGETLPKAGVAAAPAATTAVPPGAPRLAAPTAPPRFAAAPPAAPPRPSAPPSPYGPPPAAPSERQVWYPEPVITAAPAPKQSTAFGKLIIVGVVVLALVGGYTVFKNQANKVPAGTEEFAAGNGFAFDSPDGLYSAQMPSAPQTSNQPLGNVAGSFAMAYDEGDNWEVLTGSAIMPVSVSDSQVEKFFDDTGAELAAAGGSDEMKVTKTKRSTRGGMPALDIWLKDSGGNPGRIRIMVWGAKLYMYGVHAASGNARLFAALDESFVVH
jgi:hypothetical protein